MSICVVIGNLPDNATDIELHDYKSKILDAVQYAAFGLFRDCPDVRIYQEVNY